VRIKNFMVRMVKEYTQNEFRDNKVDCYIKLLNSDWLLVRIVNTHNFEIYVTTRLDQPLARISPSDVLLGRISDRVYTIHA